MASRISDISMERWPEWIAFANLEAILVTALKQPFAV